jgi:hypothetical protein
LKLAVILAAVLCLAAPLAADCPTVYNVDDPPCVCGAVKVTDSIGACFQSGHYEDACTGEITGYWLWTC